MVPLPPNMNSVPLKQRNYRGFTVVPKATIVPQLSKCLKFQAVWGVLADQMI